MTTNPSFSQFGLEAMNNYFMTNNNMISSADASSFPPAMSHDGNVGFGDPVGGTADIGAHFMTNNMMLSSLASQLFCAAPLQDNLMSANNVPNARILSEEMNAYVASDSCSTVNSLLPASVNFQFGPSDGTILLASKKVPKLNGEPQCNWSYDGPSSVHPSYYLTGLSNASFSYPFAGSAATSELSLSLGSKSSSVSMVNVPDQSSEVSCSGLTHVNSKGIGYQQSPKLQAAPSIFRLPYDDVGSEMDTGLGQMYPQNGEISLYSGYSRPVHFSQVLSRSRYVHVAQQILNEVVGHALQDVTEIADSVSGIDSEARPSIASSCSTRAPSAVSSNQLLVSSEESSHNGADGARWKEVNKLRNELLKMLQLMDQKYNQCLDEIQNTTAKFNNLTQPSSNSICAPFAHHAVSAMYQSLRRRITSEIMMVSRRPSRESLSEKERSWESSFIQKHWALQQLRRGDQQSWRPQRGLPEKSVSVLKAWMFENFLRPYPKDNEKELLAARSGLSRSQVSNWFINARVRLWKPMIEDMYEELKKNSGGTDGLAIEHLSHGDVVS